MEKKMPKIKLQEMDRYQYQIEIPVRITDVNYGGHLGNDSMVSIIHEARFRFVQQIGFKDEVEAGIILQDICIQFKAETFCNDKLTIHIALGEISRCGLRMFYKIINSDKNVAALAETGIVFIDYSTKKVSNIPEKFIAYV